MEVIGDQGDIGSGAGSADADVPDLAGDTQGDVAGLVDLVLVDAVVGLGAEVTAGGGLGQRRVEGCGRRTVRQGPVRPLLAVDLGDGVEQGLQLGEDGGLLWLGAKLRFEGLLEPFDLALGLGMVGLAFFCVMLSSRSSCSRWLRPGVPPKCQTMKTRPLSVSVDAGKLCVAADARNVASTIGSVTGRCAVTDRAQREESSNHVRISTSVNFLDAPDAGAVGDVSGVVLELGVGEVGLAGLVRLVAFEPDEGVLRSLLGLGSYGTGSGQDLVGGGPRQGCGVVVGQEPADRVRPGVQTRVVEPLAEP